MHYHLFDYVVIFYEFCYNLIVLLCDYNKG